MNIHLILGGARSGKSAYAEKLAIESNLPVTYIATAQIYDDEFKARVQHHKDRRPEHWKLVEEPHFLSTALQANIYKAYEASKNPRTKQCIIIDCLTLWLAQCICPECLPAEGVDWPVQREAFLAELVKLQELFQGQNFQGQLILVSNEVGMGIVPLGEINRQFQDEQGRLNQAVAQIADRVSFIAAGLPLKLKG
ncbi:MAG: bifunctional adenosylcobinamide kinase/adenosylcobinamide-phosphate guanylyltransferase [Candidatus Nitrotoga sp.]